MQPEPFQLRIPPNWTSERGKALHEKILAEESIREQHAEVGRDCGVCSKFLAFEGCSEMNCGLTHSITYKNMQKVMTALLRKTAYAKKLSEQIEKHAAKAKQEIERSDGWQANYQHVVVKLNEAVDEINELKGERAGKQFRAERMIDSIEEEKRAGEMSSSASGANF